ncbi:peptide chain release factor N(5)-glutamine methyltransferase [Clostridium sardiniense]|uniref:peptide chain release factor N(5)-glutamine methyltransferase n=1 Tax=Clostridium sardiniense TaxID=29369 RepID=UPI001959CEDD|nr:peptide chain release factor N(5)-glutamine methyltransferase [Clostridium sardiniense]MBM7835369.1 release factor-specific protein-(glutamine-N5) methyltransferase [Clostridium sardiniense]
MKKCDVGGQAVIEGVMMRGSKGMATAVRKEDGNIEVEVRKITPITKKYKILNMPFIRGGFILIDSLIQGIKSLNYSASFFEDTEPSAFEDWLKKKFGDKSNDVIITFTMFISFILSAFLFIAIPTGVASLFSKLNISSIGLNMIEAAIRIGILLLYMWGISKLDDIYRLFQYHGAEHKTIFCYESGEPLKVENVKKYSRFHPRCGTNFLFLIMFVSIIVFAFTGWGSFFERLLLRIILIPVVSGITYELIKWLGKSDNKLAKIIAAPGLKLQEITTREPDDSQIEVAIRSLRAAEGLPEEEMTITELLDEGTKILLNVDKENARLDATLLLGHIIGRDRLYILTHGEENINNNDKKKYLELIEKRKLKMPIKYILGSCEFMGLDFDVEEGVLIPRGDTEILVEEVLNHIGDDEKLDICDLCSGSGAIGISLAHYRRNINVDEIDYFEKPEKITIKNIKKHKLEDRIRFIKSDLLKVVIDEDKKYDIIVSNPPYIKEEEIRTLMDDVKRYEPHSALSGGEDGLVFYRRIVNESKILLKGKGILAFEIGHDQGDEVKTLMEENNFKDVRVIKDLAGHDRVVVGNFTLVEKGL